MKKIDRSSDILHVISQLSHPFSLVLPSQCRSFFLPLLPCALFSHTTVPAGLVKSPLDLHPIIALTAAGDMINLDVRAAHPEPSPESTGSSIDVLSPHLSPLPSSSCRRSVAGQLVFDCKHFKKNRVGSHLTVQKVTKSGVGAVHVKRDMWGLLHTYDPHPSAATAAARSSRTRASTAEAEGAGLQIAYFEVTFGLVVPATSADVSRAAAARAATAALRTGTSRAFLHLHHCPVWCARIAAPAPIPSPYFLSACAASLIAFPSSTFSSSSPSSSASSSLTPWLLL